MNPVLAEAERQLYGIETSVPLSMQKLILKQANKNRLIAIGCGPSRHATIRQRFTVAAIQRQHPTHLLRLFDGHLFENIAADRARHGKNRDRDKGRLGRLQ